MPPTRFLGLPWPEWGETDRLLIQATALAAEQECPCGCGQWRDDCTDDDKAGRWQIITDTCHARNAIDDWSERHKDDLEPGQLIGVHLLPEGVDPVDPLEFNPAIAAGEYDALQQRLAKG